MKIRIVGFLAASALALSIMVVPLFGAAPAASAAKGCKAFGQVTAAGAPVGEDMSAIAKADPPGQIPSEIQSECLKAE
jgi:hypothetical protein